MGIIGDYQKLKEMGYGQPLYSVFKTYFDRIDKGYKSESDSTKNIFAYNGGLFKPDETLDNLTVGDDVLFIHSKRLADYDFESQISVDILGRIFENSLTEIEEVQKEIEAEKSGEKVEINNIGKRKKDGVFYTPEYITKYIVENTIGKLCEQQRTKLNISDEEVAKAQTKKQKDTLNAALHEYQKWLFSLKILDPACGSGAFLTAALTQLKAEHRRVFDFLHAINNDSMMFEEYSDNSILENNLYGVDINEESVEITKLSLWLHTAQKDRKLTTLNNKIKCGNSLIDDSAIAGEKAFKWEEEFPEVFGGNSRDKGGENKHGFDVIIGNPPYVDIKQLNPNDVKYFFSKYKTCENRINLYSIFIEKAYSLLTEKGVLSFINPNSLLVNSSYQKLRELILADLYEIIKLPDGVFKDANVETMIFMLQKNSTEENVNCLIFKRNDIITEIKTNSEFFIGKNEWKKNGSIFNLYVSSSILSILAKIEKSKKHLIEMADFSLGITPYDKYKGHSEYVIKNRKFHSSTKIDESYKPLIDGSNIIRFFVSSTEKEYIKYGDWLGAKREERFFTEPRIIVRQIVSGNPPRIYAGYTEQPLYFTQIGFSIISKGAINNKTLLCILNSDLMNFYHKFKFLDLEKDIFQKVLIANCKEFPIPEIPLEAQQPFIALADKILTLNETLQKKSTNFLKVVKQTFALEKISTKLETFYNLDFDGFMKELKQKVTPKTKLEWLEVFEETKKSLQDLKQQIDSTDKEINALVYKLYNLTDEEIKIVEGR